MKLQQWMAIGIVASVPLAAAAQPPSAPSPLDSNAAVPAATYTSAFKNYQPAPSSEQPSPDKVWRSANDEVAKSEDHAGHASDAAQKTPVSSSAPAKAPAMDHSKHN